MSIVFDNNTKLTYTNVGKVEEKPPVKTLDVISKPAVLCPFTKHYATLDRCRQCNNYCGFINKGRSIKCKWPY